VRLTVTLKPSEKISTTAWAREYRRLSQKGSGRPGRYNPDLTPWVAGMHAALDNPDVREVAAMKSAQVAWTDGVVNNYVGRRIDVDPCPIIILFAKEGAAKEYNDEKFVPMVEATPRLASKLPVHKRRDRDNRWQFKQFPGGFLKFVGSNSPTSVKSTPAPVAIVEEPDDCNTDVANQGDSITILHERQKTYTKSKFVMGGTPTIAGLSRIEMAYKAGDQQKFFVPCHRCGQEHVLAWENVKWSEDPKSSHEIYGHALPETSVYVCPHCQWTWADAEKNRNVRKGHWVASAPFHGVASFYINELYSPFNGSRFYELTKKYLEARHAFEQGDDSKLKSFRNNQEGLPYEFASDLPDTEVLEARAEDYPEWVVPHGAWVITAGVDVQGNRLAVVVKAWGPGEESWLLYWGELYGQTVVPNAGAWEDLDALLSKPIPHADGGQLFIRAVSVDSSDGNTSDAVYTFVRSRQSRGYMAIKGSSMGDEREIFSPPRTSVDTNNQQKAHKYGLRPFIVGGHRAKDLILGSDASGGRIKLTGVGPGRMHWYKGVRPDYYEQITSEVKAPHRTMKKKLVWQKKSGVRNEALDCEVYALHAARSLKINLWKAERWADEEAKIRQPDLLGAQPDQPAVKTQQPKQPAQQKPSGFFNAPSGGYSATDW